MRHFVLLILFALCGFPAFCAEPLSDQQLGNLYGGWEDCQDATGGCPTQSNCKTTGWQCGICTDTTPNRTCQWCIFCDGCPCATGTDHTCTTASKPGSCSADPAMICQPYTGSNPPCPGGTATTCSG
jgi:hypothetical protein